jgi:predicted AAA+ superfamily ATPase
VLKYNGTIYVLENANGEFWFSRKSFGPCVERTRYLETIQERLKRFPVVSVLGPRQVGKTTLAQAGIEGKGRSQR